jgi:hypothetical protein
MANQYDVTGSMTPEPEDVFTMSLKAKPPGGSTPTPDPPPTQPPPPTLPPPVDTHRIAPSGGDDTGLIQNALNDLASGHALMLSGFFQVGTTLWLDGYQKILMADPAKPSGIRVTANNLSGHYGALLCTTPNTSRCRILNLDFDGQGHQAQLVYFDGGHENLIDGCYLHDIAFNPSGAPYAAIHSGGDVVNLVVRNNRIERTTGIDGGEGVRGIWLCGVSGIVVVGNRVKDTGHTCISAEGATVLMARNHVGNSLTQGTGMKICYRNLESPGRSPIGIVFAQNTIDTTVGAGLMLQDIDSAPGGVLVQENTFKNCGREGTSFGAIYSSNDAANVTFRGNRVENCRSIAALRSARNWLFEQTTIVGAGDTVNLEDGCHDITLDRSGKVSVGSNCSNVKVDGVGVA